MDRAKITFGNAGGNALDRGVLPGSRVHIAVTGWYVARTPGRLDCGATLELGWQDKSVAFAKRRRRSAPLD